MGDQDYLSTGLMVTLFVVFANILAFYILIPLALRYLIQRKFSPIEATASAATVEAEPTSSSTDA